MTGLGTLTSVASNSAASQRLALLVQTVATALKDPTAHAPMVLLVLVAAGAILMIVLSLVYLIVTLIRDWRNPPPVVVRQAAAPREKAEGVTAVRVLVWAAAVAIVATAAVSGYRYGVSDKTCARCHFTSAAIASHARDTHAKVACSACHVTPGPAGAVAAVAHGVRNVTFQAVSQSEEATSAEARVDSASCLSCHNSVTSGVVIAGSIRMRHSDVIAVGYACTDCHGGVGHVNRVVRPRYPTMGQCVQCHDGKKASSACSTCHSGDVGVPSGARAAQLDIPKATIHPDGCRGCHSMNTCIQCHGLELPHSDAFKNGSHARKALLEPQTCVKCHDITTFCNGCHQFTVKNGLPASPHGTVSAFIEMHKKSGSANDESASCSCHTQGGPRAHLCADCHGKQPER
jgi:hypothetical protein